LSFQGKLPFMLKRTYFDTLIDQYFLNHPAVALLGPRQCGKTTLAKFHSKNIPSGQYFDLEDDTDIQRLASPKLALENREGLIVIDEIQRRPALFTALRVLIDNPQKNQQYLILGSASRELIQQSAETLAGRIAYIELTPFSSAETHEWRQLWLRGGFPKSYLAHSNRESAQWREFYIMTFLEQDIPQLGIQIPSVTLRRFWIMLSHYHGNIFNASELARSFGISDTTVKRYLDILSGTFMIRQLLPWKENIKKRQVKAPKIYFRDSGLLHAFLNIENEEDLLKHPKLGASWEGFALEETIRKLGAKPHECFFWASHSGAELDLLILQKNKKLGFEFKYTDAPKLTKSMKISMEDLNLDQLTVIYPGKHDYTLVENIDVKSFEHFIE
jgi:predicted AAA+ superfamily ATPase